MSFHDPIVEELYVIRQKLLEECNHDLRELARRQQESPLPPGMRMVTIEEALAHQRELDADSDALAAHS